MIERLANPRRPTLAARPWRLVALAYLLVALVAALVYRSTIAAQADATVALATVLETPVLTSAVERLTDEPDVDETTVAGMPTTLARPRGSRAAPAIVFLNGATARGRRHPDVQALARGLARAGYVVLVPDLPGLRDGEITTRTLRAAKGVVAAAVRRRHAKAGKVALVGVSVGGTLALLAAEDRELGRRVSVVAAIAPYGDLVDVYRLATTGHYEDDGRLVRYETSPFLLLVAARSLVASLPAGRDRAALLSVLSAIAENETDELVVRLPPGGLGPDARAVVALLLNRDPRRFDELYAALPPSIRAAHRRLSPLAAADALRAPVELASAPRDKYFPVAESRELARRAPDARVTVTSTLEHAIPEPGDVPDLLRFDAFVVRTLERAAAP